MSKPVETEFTFQVPVLAWFAVEVYWQDRPRFNSFRGRAEFLDVELPTLKDALLMSMVDSHGG